MTTSRCLCHPNRNKGLDKKGVENIFSEKLGTERILWLDHGLLLGDDTDGHIDTLARFVNSDTIVYVKCDDKDDEHYDELLQMERQLESFKTKGQKTYNLIPLPMPKPKYNAKNERLPATYANFLISNGSVVYPTYSDKSDKKIGEILKKLFPEREVIPINCLRLIEQGGSLHCSTMQISY